MRIKYEEMVSEFERVLNKYGITGEDGHLAATLFADASRDGVYSHGLNRFPTFIKYIADGDIIPGNRAHLVSSFGPFERWDGELGPGNLNAYICTKRAIELAKKNTVGIVALSNTNHWMRPGNYGLLAAENNCVGIMWTNTMPNMPAWGGKDAKIGNNPIVFAIPHKDEPVILDVAMSMFSYGKLEKLMLEGKETPVDAGYDKYGNVTRKPEDVIESRQVFPIGYWKGSGLSIVLDLIAAILSSGDTTRLIGTRPGETGLSQFFMCIDLSAFPDREEMEKKITDTLNDIRSSLPLDEKHPVHTPGDGLRKVREESMREGVLVDEGKWKTVLEL